MIRRLFSLLHGLQETVFRGAASFFPRRPLPSAHPSISSNSGFPSCPGVSLEVKLLALLVGKAVGVLSGPLRCIARGPISTNLSPCRRFWTPGSRTMHIARLSDIRSRRRRAALRPARKTEGVCLRVHLFPTRPSRICSCKFAQILRFQFLSGSDLFRRELTWNSVWGNSAGLSLASAIDVEFRQSRDRHDFGLRAAGKCCSDDGNKPFHGRSSLWSMSPNGARR